MRFLSVEGVTGQEAAIAAAVTDELKKVGVPASAIRFDDANKRIPLPTQTGNLIVDLPGTRPARGCCSRRISTRSRSVRGAKPRREGDRIVSDGTTALGGDDRTGCRGAGDARRDAAEAQAAAPTDHPALHRSRGERSAWRARAQPADLGGAKMCFNVDGKLASELIVGAVGQENWEVEIKGKASHAGVARRRASRPRWWRHSALAEAHRGGLVRQGGRSPRTGHQQRRHFRREGRQAGRRCDQRRHRLRLHQGRGAQPRGRLRDAIALGLQGGVHQSQGRDQGRERRHRRSEIRPRSPPIPRSSWTRTRRSSSTPGKRARNRWALKPTYLFSNGGLDANWLDKHGIPTVTIGAGQYEIHTVNEYVDLPEFARGCRLAIALATQRARHAQ